jgi:hypothetical protein
LINSEDLDHFMADPAEALAPHRTCELKGLMPEVARKITRDLNEDVRDRVRALANTEAFQQSRRERKKVEMRFAHMKRILGLDRFRLRGLSGIRDEVLPSRQALMASIDATTGSATNERPELKTMPCNRDTKSFATESSE